MADFGITPPIDYMRQFPQVNIGENLLRGVQAGAFIQQANAQAEAEAQARAVQAQFASDMAQFQANPTPDAARNLMLRYPGMAKVLEPVWKGMTEEQKDAQFSAIGQVWHALSTGNKETALSVLDERIAAMKNSKKDTREVEQIRAGIEAAPDTATAGRNMLSVMTLLDPKRTEEMLKARNEATKAPFTINPKDMTPESLAKYKVSGDWKDLVPSEEHTTFYKELKDAGIQPGTAEWEKAMKARISRETSPTGAQVRLQLGSGQTPADKPEELSSDIALARTGMPSSQIVKGWGKQAGDRWEKIKNGAIEQIMEETGVPRAQAAQLFASEQQGYKADTMALAQNTKDIASIRPYESMLTQNSDIAINLAEKAVATSSKFANKTINWLRTNAADNPDVAEYLAQMRLVSTEAARVITNPRLVGQLTDTARQEIDEIINGNMPINATKRVLRRMQNDAKRRVTEMERERDRLMKKEPRAQASTDISSTLPPRNAKGWSLKKDAKGNMAYVSPDGKQYEEVK